jgi:hypothetical protein
VAHVLNDDLHRRLRAARPPGAEVDPAAFDAALLARVRALPLDAPSRARRLAVPAAATVAVGATAFVLLAGGPGDTGGPPTAAAIEQALHWFQPPSGTILHTRAVGTTTGADGQATTVERESWQAANDPGRTRTVTRTGSTVVEVAAGAIYDGQTDTIYEPTDGEKTAALPKPPADAAGGEKTEKRAVPDGLVKPTEPGGGDPTVAKVRSLLDAGRATVRGRELHDGVDAWAIALAPGTDGPSWTLWVSAADGRPLALHDPGDAATGDVPEDEHWTAYEVLPSTGADALVTLTGAHPDALVVRDDAQFQAALDRLQQR